MLDEGSARVAGLLRERGVQPGDRVGIMLPNVPYFAVVYYGVLRVGGVVVPMNVLLKGREVAFYCEDSGAKIVFAWHGFAEAAEPGAEAGGRRADRGQAGRVRGRSSRRAEPARDVAERADDDTAVILYTSGTTGTPKGAELTHDNLTQQRETCSRDLFSRPRRTRARRAAAVPLLRPDVRR